MTPKPQAEMPGRARYVDAESNIGVAISVGAAIFAAPLGWVAPLISILGILVVAHSSERWRRWYRAANQWVRDTYPPGDLTTRGKDE